MTRGGAVTPLSRIGVVGAGVTGSRVVAQLLSLGHTSLVVTDTTHSKAQQLGSLYRSPKQMIHVVDASEMSHCDVVVLACAKPHTTMTRSLAERGVHVVSISDDVSDTVSLIELNEEASSSGTTVVVGAAASPGLSALLVDHVRGHFDSIDEVHVALHGTGGPDCAHQHHDALAGQSIGWHDDDWLRRPAGSGRELCWFPEPVGAYDCYRAEMADPVLLKHAMPELQRITARMSATRRDRFTSRLPMMAPPHAEGGMGSVRVEVRGWRSGARVVEILGVAERVAQIAGVVAGSTAHLIATGGLTTRGVVALGSSTVPNSEILKHVQQAGIHLQEFVGS